MQNDLPLHVIIQLIMTNDILSRKWHVLTDRSSDGSHTPPVTACLAARSYFYWQLLLSVAPTSILTTMHSRTTGLLWSSLCSLSLLQLCQGFVTTSAASGGSGGEVFDQAASGASRAQLSRGQSPMVSAEGGDGGVVGTLEHKHSFRSSV